MTLISTFSEISREASFIHNQICREAEKNQGIKSLYKGCQLLFSPLLERPKILLIGFNPGGGYFSWHGKIAENFEPMSKLEYYQNKHSLGEQTKELFRLASREEDLEHNAVKTNFYYWATDNVADFNQLLKLLPEELSKKVYHQARVWTGQLIEAIQPKMIVAEGFKAFDEIKVLFPKKLEQEKTEFHKSFLTPGGIKVLGYKRNQGSIVGKEIVKTLFIQKINQK